MLNAKLANARDQADAANTRAAAELEAVRELLARLKTARRGE